MEALNRMAETTCSLLPKWKSTDVGDADLVPRVHRKPVFCTPGGSYFAYSTQRVSRITVIRI